MLINSSLASKESRNKLEQRLRNLKWACCQQVLAAQLAFNILLAHGILQFAGQKRVLNDQRRTIQRYEKSLKKTRMQQEALGLPLEKY